MRKFLITEKLIEIAEKKSKEMGALRRSITGGEGNVAGFIGEYLARHVYGGTIQNTYQSDIVLPNSETADVKTKRTTVEPKLYYESSIYKEGTFQKCDRYIFVRVDIEKHLGWVIGSISKKDYFEKATFHKKGDYDPDNDFTFKHDCYNLKYSELEPC